MIDTPQILLVENEQSVIDQITEMINKIGFNRPQVASTPDEAKNLAGTADIALVGLDTGDPDNGRKTARMLSEDFNLPVIYLISPDDNYLQGNSPENTGFVLKPGDRRNLKKVIMLALARHNQKDDFTLLISDLPVPAFCVDPLSLEILVSNEFFITLFPEVDSSTGAVNLRVGLKSELENIVQRTHKEKGLVRHSAILNTSAGSEPFVICARETVSFTPGAVIVTLQKTEPVKEDVLFEFSPVRQLQISKDGFILQANRKWLTDTGYTRDYILKRPVADLFYGESAGIWTESILPGLLSDNSYGDLCLDVKKADGEVIRLNAHFSILPTDGSVLAAFIEPVTTESLVDEEATLANALRDTAEVLTSTLNFDEVLDRILARVSEVVPNEAANIMMIWSGVAYIVRSTGYAELGLEERMMSLQIPVAQETHYLSMYETGMPLAVADIQDYAALQSHTDINWARSMASAPLRSKGQVFGFLNLESSQPGFYNQKHADRLQAFADQAAVAIENARLYAEVQQYAITDELTDIYNRRGLFELGRREVERARRYGRSLSAVMIDTDHFKSINDTYSHGVGDHVLRVMADRWKSSIREVDILGRYGGDEFVVLLPETDLNSAVQVADRLRVAISGSKITTPMGEIGVSVSVGVAEINNNVTTFDALLEKADQAMFQAKTGGKNQVSY